MERDELIEQATKYVMASGMGFSTEGLIKLAGLFVYERMTKDRPEKPPEPVYDPAVLRAADVLCRKLRWLVSRECLLPDLQELFNVARARNRIEDEASAKVPHEPGANAYDDPDKYGDRGACLSGQYDTRRPSRLFDR